jgi:hypothetical protein
VSGQVLHPYRTTQKLSVQDNLAFFRESFGLETLCIDCSLAFLGMWVHAYLYLFGVAYLLICAGCGLQGRSGQYCIDK